jgi:hypothetical protein
MNAATALYRPAITRPTYPPASIGSVKAHLTSKRPRPTAGNDAYAAFAHRIRLSVMRIILLDC